MGHAMGAWMLGCIITVGPAAHHHENRCILSKTLAKLNRGDMIVNNIEQHAQICIS